MPGEVAGGRKVMGMRKKEALVSPMEFDKSFAFFQARQAISIEKIWWRSHFFGFADTFENVRSLGKRS